MKNWAIVFLISSLLTALGFAQEHGQQAPAGHETGAAAAASSHEASSSSHDAASSSHEAKHDEGDPQILWKWVNFAILAIALGFVASKNLPAFFAGRTEEIQKGIAEAQKLKTESDARTAAMEQRMAKLGAEIEELKTKGNAEFEAEATRIRKETEAAVAKMRSNAEAEIESAAKAARQELHNYSVKLAVDLAGQRLSANPGVEANLFNRFIRDLESKGAANN